MRRLTMVSAGLAAILSLGAATAQAQSNTGSLTATATVLSPINVSKVSDLDFGQVLPGIAKAVAVTDATAGQFHITGAASKNINLTFSLPSNLDDGSGHLLPIGSWTGYQNAAQSPSAGGSSFTPSASATATAVGGAGDLYVYMGATVTPAVAQTAGTYTGNVQMTVVYF